MVPNWLVTGTLAFATSAVIGIVIAGLSGKRTLKQALLLALAVSIGLVIGNAV
ncbi:hypothetical protein GCM10008985_39030 [Halococcus dombrowskii]|uniref:Uncharacterized protein n=1 Tax=Halococcus dombrowskii TaxID=179637 RepID=A0AAV3SMZ2_HALDO